jgi:exodeoxyribonuclease VII large subunit
MLRIPYIEAVKTDQPILTVSEITRRVKQLLEGGFAGIVVQGELSNFKIHTSGHMYFTLKDESAQIAGVMWRSRVGSLSFVPEDGMKVVVSGRITVYEPRGAYQIDATSMRPLGVGELQAAFEKLKQKLSAEGLFDASRKKPLPEFPQRIGIVTSETGAAFRDMIAVFRRRFPAVTLVLRPTRVQGVGAAQDIADAIAEFNRFGGTDLLIVGRGGGSLEDLWAFNEEVVARAIAASGIPIVSAVGHEIDFTIADFVADLRAPTPTAAAELAVRDRAALLEILNESVYTMRDNVASIVRERRRRILHLLESYAFNRPIDLFRQQSQRFDEITRVLQSSTEHLFALTRSRTTALQQRIASLNPRQVLKRGYAMVLREGNIISSSNALHPDDLVDVEFHDGSVRSRVVERK